MTNYLNNRFWYECKIFFRLVKKEKTIFQGFIFFSSFFSALFSILCKFTFAVLHLEKRQNKKIMETTIFEIFQANGAKSEQNLLMFYKILSFFSIILFSSILIIESFYLFIHFQRYAKLKASTISIKQSLGIAPAKIVYELFKEHFLLLFFCSLLSLFLEKGITSMFFSKLPGWINGAIPSYIGAFYSLYILFLLLIIFYLTKLNIAKNYSSL
ncbi:MAG: hypothetical protein LBS28_03435 [Streptococcaceae bacterium]|jgi:hypothetical protein|nr:hypothetical protein [Streptococcaceae bacterium]